MSVCLMSNDCPGANGADCTIYRIEAVKRNNVTGKCVFKDMRVRKEEAKSAKKINPLKASKRKGK